MKAFHSDLELKELVGRYLTGNLRSSTSDRRSVITLPIKTVDDRWVSVIVEEKQPGYFWVHDGGKTDSELFCQGVTMETVESFNGRVASRYGVASDGRIIQKFCTGADLPQTIMAVAEASAVMAAQLVSRLIEVETEDIEAEVSETLDLWRRDEFEIKHELEVKGRWDRYVFDFMARAKDNKARKTAAINILPGANALRTARDYGMMLVDLKGMDEYRDLASLAIIVGAAGWSDRARKLVKNFASDTIEITPETQRDIGASMLKKLNAITSPALPLKL